MGYDRLPVDTCPATGGEQLPGKPYSKGLRASCSKNGQKLCITNELLGSRTIRQEEAKAEFGHLLPFGFA